MSIAAPSMMSAGAAAAVLVTRSRLATQAAVADARDHTGTKR
jgi:hypothetical protein